MAPASNEEQFRFLISCIRYSNNGKVDFGQVAKECNIVSKGAAAKRYERMMKANNIAPNAASIKPAPVTRAPKPERRESASASKKRKVKNFLEDMSAADDDEDYSNIKPDPASESEKFIVKSEGEEVGEAHGPGLEFAEGLLQYYPQTTPTPDVGSAYEYNNGDDTPTPLNSSIYGYRAALKSENYDSNGADYGFASPGYVTPDGYHTPGYHTPMGAAFGLEEENTSSWDGNGWVGGTAMGGNMAGRSKGDMSSAV